MDESKGGSRNDLFKLTSSFHVASLPSSRRHFHLPASRLSRFHSLYRDPLSLVARFPLPKSLAVDLLESCELSLLLLSLPSIEAVASYNHRRHTIATWLLLEETRIIKQCCVIAASPRLLVELLGKQEEGAEPELDQGGPLRYRFLEQK